MTDDDARLERAILGALRAAIHDHGPITLDTMSSAAKRIVGNLANAGGVGAAAMGRRRWRGTTAEEREAVASSGGRAAWEGLSPEERSAEMRRRAKRRAATK